MSRFNFTPTPLSGLFVAEAKPIADSRGYFERYFCSEDFREIGLDKPIAQINHSLTRQKGSIRGLHFQTHPHSEVKIVRCLGGAIFDVALDLRLDSPTFGRHFGVVLDAKSPKYLFIPEGFAHGFQALSDDAEILYLVTAAFEPASDSALNPLCPFINIPWRLALTDISPKDKNAPFLDAAMIEKLKRHAPLSHGGGAAKHNWGALNLRFAQFSAARFAAFRFTRFKFNPPRFAPPRFAAIIFIHPKTAQKSISKIQKPLKIRVFSPTAPP